MTSLLFRQATQDDMPRFDEIRQQKLHKLHAARIKEQKKGNAEYIIAFEGSDPVGHVFIIFGRDDGYSYYPKVEDLFVKEMVRERGIATKILQEAERLVKEKGFHEIYLEYEITEPSLKKFYEQRGYVVIEGPVEDSWVNHDKGGELVRMSVFRMRKTL